VAQESSFADLMARLRAGDGRAASLIFRRFEERLIALARSRLSDQLRRKVDPEDVLQSVFRSFFRQQASRPFDLSGWDSLWSLLTVITLRKCGHRVEYFHAACRDVRREAAPPPSAEDSDAAFEAIAREPTPSEAAMLTETLEQVLRGLEGYQRRIVELSLQGHTPAEVGAAVGRTQRTVQRVLKRVRDRLERLRAEGADDTCG
jgi:RNA polymerase sigma-70 factor (ECF subfamily)